MEIALSLIFALIILRYAFRGVMSILRGLVKWLARAITSHDPEWRAEIEANIQQEEVDRKASRTSWLGYLLRSLGMMFLVLAVFLLFIALVVNAP